MKTLSAFGVMLLVLSFGAFANGAEATATKTNDSLDPAAAWQAGLVRLDDQWLKADDAGKKLADDPLYKTYCQKRDALVDTADNHRELARWCRKHHLTAEERLHWQKVLEFEKQDAEAIAGLGLELHNGRLLSRAQLKADKDEDLKRRQAAQTWRPKIGKWRTAIERGTAEQAAQALDELKQLDDPRALPVLEQVFTSKAGGAKGAQLATLLVQTAGRIQDPIATQILLRQAVFGLAALPACEELKKRPPHAYVPLLIAAMPAELKTKYHVVTLPGGAVSHEHEVLIDSPQGALSFTYESTVQPTDWMIAAEVTPAALRREVGKAQVIEAQARATEAQLRPLRERIQFVLKQTTGFDSVDNPQLWLKQYADYYGWGAPDKKETIRQHAWDYEVYYPIPPPPEPMPEFKPSTESQPQSPTSPRGTWGGPGGLSANPSGGRWGGPGGLSASAPVIFRGECFAPGTPVMTLSGLQPIETIKPGDRVLARDVVSGEVTFKSVQTRTLRQSVKVLKIHLGNDTITATSGHPFWVVGQGWTVAKFLEPGMKLLGLEGEFTVDRLEPQPRTEVYNLVVNDFATYFVGNSRLLVHDDTTLTEVPADAQLVAQSEGKP